MVGLKVGIKNLIVDYLKGTEMKTVMRYEEEI